MVAIPHGLGDVENFVLQVRKEYEIEIVIAKALQTCFHDR